MGTYSNKDFEWTDEFVFRVLARGIFPKERYDIQDTKNAVMDAINGRSDSAIIPDEEHRGKKAVFPIKGRLASFPFVIDRGKIVVKSAFYSEKKDKENYAK
jgi:hypothetical protein